MPYNLTGLTVVNGTAAAEAMNGSSASEAIYGNGGADTLSGGLGKDILFGADAGTTFLFVADGTWSGYSASNSGDPGAPAPAASFSINGFGRTHDVFVGTGTNNTLVMANGKNVLFLEDNVSPNVQTVRLVNIQNIVLGTGGQIVDLTSSAFSYGAVNITGGTGNDVLMSNAGSDTLSGANGADYIWGGSGNDLIDGGTGDDNLLGGNGNDTMDGNTGRDTMNGGAGDDVFVVADSTDVVTEAASQGTDVVQSSITYTLGSNVENLTLTGSGLINGTGNTLANTISGNAQRNTLDGGAGADKLYGFDGTDSLRGGADNDLLDGGNGLDTMLGGTGDDTYVVSEAGDIVTEAANEGTDLVLSAVTLTLLSNVENLTLTGTANLNGTGNTLDNRITGNAGANRIDGGDGKDFVFSLGGNDTIYGGAGNDSMFGREGQDQIFGGEGIDNLNGGADNDTLTGGNGNDGLWGGGLHDTLIAEAGNDKLYGDGGNDTLVGGAGNDWMYGGQLNGQGVAAKDTFQWSRSDIVNAAGVRVGYDTILDFRSDDVLDMRAVFAGGAALPVADRIAVRDSVHGTIVSVHVDGVAGFLDTVILRGLHGVTLSSLVSGGDILA